MPEIPAPDFRGKTVLITGGTKGIGRAVGLSFASRGANCVLTHKWDSADQEELGRAYAECGGAAPLVVQSDVSSDEDLKRLFDTLEARGTAPDVLISNVSFSFVTASLEDYRQRSLYKSLEYSAWPFVSYARETIARFGRPPKYAIGVSSPGPDYFHTGYDFAASSKAVMEAFSRYLTARLADHDTRFNVVRPAGVFTDSLDSTFGDSFKDFALKLSGPEHYLKGEDVGNVIVALCSGWLDGIGGQVIDIDRGTHFFDGAMRLYETRDRYGI